MDEPSGAKPDPAGLAATPFGEVPVEITVSVGRARPLLRELMALSDDAIFPLDKTLDDPVELFVGDKLIARGQLEEIGEDGSGKLGVRLTEVVALGEKR